MGGWAGALAHHFYRKVGLMKQVDMKELVKCSHLAVVV